MPTLPADILRRPAAEAARLIALDYLDAAAQALPRLGDPDDSEGLHDFRVALRRLRSTLRAYRPQLLGSVRKKERRQLRRLARATGPGRDAEVQIAWLRGQHELLGPRERPGLRWLIGRLEGRLHDAYADVSRESRRRFEKPAQRLRRRLGVYERDVQVDGTSTATFAAAAAETLREHVGALSRRLSAVAAPTDGPVIHAARIAAKRVRYLLEPFVRRVPAGPALLRRLQALQDTLGALTDGQVLERELEHALAAATGERARRTLAEALEPESGTARAPRRADPQRGIVALARLGRSRRDALFAKLKSEWLEAGGGAERLKEDLDAAAAYLESASRAEAPAPAPIVAPTARRRRYARPKTHSGPS